MNRDSSSDSDDDIVGVDIGGMSPPNHSSSSPLRAVGSSSNINTFGSNSGGGRYSRNVPPPLASTALPHDSSSLEVDLELLGNTAPTPTTDDSFDQQQQQQPTSTSSNLQQINEDDNDDHLGGHSTVNVGLLSPRNQSSQHITTLQTAANDEYEEDTADQPPPSHHKYLCTTREDRDREEDEFIDKLGDQNGGGVGVDSTTVETSGEEAPYIGGGGRQIMYPDEDDDNDELGGARRSVAASAPPRPLLQGPPFDNVFEHPGKFVEGGKIRVITQGSDGDAESSRLHMSSPIKDVSCCTASSSDLSGAVNIEELRVSIPSICCMCSSHANSKHHAFVKRRLVEGVGTTTLTSCWVTSSSSSSPSSIHTSTTPRRGDGARRLSTDTTTIEMSRFDGKGRREREGEGVDQDLYSNSSTSSGTHMTASGTTNMIGCDHIDCDGGSNNTSTRHVFNAATGPHQGYLASTIIMVCTPVVLYIAFTLNDQPQSGLIDALHIIVLFMVGVMLWSLAKTATSNPGYVPKGLPLQEEDDTPKAIKTYADTGMPIDTIINGGDEDKYSSNGDDDEDRGTRRLSSNKGNASKTAPVVERRWCFLCNVYRPLRSSHCEYCNVCVDRRDHHCPWTGTCIGRNNYPWFFTFITSTTICALLGIIVSTASFYLRVDRLRHNINQTNHTLSPSSSTTQPNQQLPPPHPTPTTSSATAFNDTILSPLITDLEDIPSAWSLLDDAASETYDMEFIVLLFSCCAFFVVGSLVVYHMGLVLNNTTTREDLRSEFTKDPSQRHHHVASLHKPKYLPSCCMPLYINCTRKKSAPTPSSDTTTTSGGNGGDATRTHSSSSSLSTMVSSRGALSPYDKGSGWNNVKDVLWSPIMSEVRGLTAWEGFLRLGLNITTYNK